MPTLADTAVAGGEPATARSSVLLLFRGTVLAASLFRLRALLAALLHPQVVLHVLAAKLVGDLLDGILGLASIYRAFESDLAALHGDGQLARIDVRILAQPLGDQLLDALVAALVPLGPLAMMRALALALVHAAARAVPIAVALHAARATVALRATVVLRSA